MDEEEKEVPEEDTTEKTPAEIMTEMKAEFDAKIAEKDAEISRLKAEHVKQVKDILTGKDKGASAFGRTQETAEEIAARLSEYFGGKAARRNKT